MGEQAIVPHPPDIGAIENQILGLGNIKGRGLNRR